MPLMKPTPAQKRVMEMVRDHGIVRAKDWRSVEACEKRGWIRQNTLPNGMTSWMLTNAGVDNLKASE
jgi:hypothetical protein